MQSALNRRRHVIGYTATALLLCCSTALLISPSPAHADIYKWEYINPADPSQGKQQSTTLAPDGAGVDAVPGANLSNRNLTKADLIGAALQNAIVWDATLTDADFNNAEIRGADFSLSGSSGRATGISLVQIYSTASYQAKDLSGVGLFYHDLAGGDFSGQNLANADLGGALLTCADFRGSNLTKTIFSDAHITGADFTGAVVRGANFEADFFHRGITLAQLYSTASYHAGDLSGINFSGNDLTEAIFVGQNLTNTVFSNPVPNGADFTAADTRGFGGPNTTDAITTNLIRPDGHIDGVDLGAGGRLVVRDYDGGSHLRRGEPPSPKPILVTIDPIPITVDEHWAMGPGGTLRMVFEADAWDSTISFAPDIAVVLGGTLELTFAADVDIASQRGRTFDLFDWTGVSPTGDFTVDTAYHWDMSALYTTGEVTLLAVPEPGTLLIPTLALAALLARNLAKSPAGSRVLLVVASVSIFVDFSAPIHADIYKWEYINPADPGQGKQQSTTLAPDGAGVDAVPSADLSHRNLTMAYLRGTSLTDADFSFATLTGAELTGGNLRNVSFDAATLTDADFTGADVREASFIKIILKTASYPSGTGITPAQLYATASYLAHDLRGIRFDLNDLPGASFAEQNLTNADFGRANLTGANFSEANLTNAIFIAYFTFADQVWPPGPIRASATLTDADFTGAEVRGAIFDTLTLPQLYSSASYLARDLTGIGLSGDLSGGNFAGQNLANATFSNATLTNADFSDANLANARFNDRNLYVSYSSLAGANLVRANLTNADFSGATLAGVDLADADVRGANFNKESRIVPALDYENYTFGTGITTDQLASTASYKAHDLSGIYLAGNDLAGGNFVGQNLTNSHFGIRYRHYAYGNIFVRVLYASLSGADFTGADIRGGIYVDLSGATTDNLIRTNGHIEGLALDDGGLLVVRDYDGNPNDESGYPGPPMPIQITVDQHLTMASGGTLQMVFEADAWDSTISLAPGIPVTLGGTLELTFAADVNPASQLGRTFDLFDWTGVAPTGAFAVSTPYAWDLSKLYTTGEVTLTAVPEPTTLVLLMIAAIGWRAQRGRS